MRTWLVALAAALLGASVAHADEGVTTRDVQAVVDAYVETEEEAPLFDGLGTAGYDAGFWIRQGPFLLRVGATLQARFEAWSWSDEAAAARAHDGPSFAGDTSGFSLPRATLKLSGEVPCNVRWYVELEFGHFGRDPVRSDGGTEALGPSVQTENFAPLREAWVEWRVRPLIQYRLGQVSLPTTRQLMTAPELQQFVAVSYASAFTVAGMPGATDRNRDHGLLVHGVFGFLDEWTYLASVTNGDGADSVRNVLDHRTSDNLAYGARLNWAPLEPIGYEEGALRQRACRLYGEIGGWFWAYADRADKPHLRTADALLGGVDVALGYGGFSFTSALTWFEYLDADSGGDIEGSTWLAQLGYLIPGTALELAVRASGVDLKPGDESRGDLTEYAAGINYYLNGHANKLQLDVTFLEASGNFTGVPHVYPGIQGGFSDENRATLLRFQWQLAL